jgi:hypothetical protein
MKLNINSVTARLYRWFYATAKMPQSLCPYFWKLGLMWVFIIPYSVISLPTILMDLRMPDDRGTFERIGVGGITWVMLGMLACMLSWIGLFFAEPAKDGFWIHAIAIGLIGWGAATVFGVAGLFKWSKEKWENRHVKYDKNGYRIWEPVKEKEPSLVVEFIKATYNKYCPKIDWTYNTDRKNG